jgi:tRNA threonylcarbamoyladenosine biosynthesis protein TsaB
VRILGIESAGRWGGVALVLDGVVAGCVELSGRTPQGQRVMPSVEWLLERMGLGVGDLDGIGVGIGPGSYTGLRVGVAVAKALAWAEGIPLAGVPTLEAMALRAGSIYPRAVILPLLDARSGAVHGGFFMGGGELNPSVSAPLGEVVGRAVELAEGQGLEGVCPVGEGWMRYEEQIREILGARLRECPRWLSAGSAVPVGLLAWERIRLGRWESPVTLEPHYQFKGTLAWD